MGRIDLKQIPLAANFNTLSNSLWHTLCDRLWRRLWHTLWHTRRRRRRRRRRRSSHRTRPFPFFFNSLKRKEGKERNQEAPATIPATGFECKKDKGAASLLIQAQGSLPGRQDAGLPASFGLNTRTKGRLTLRGLAF